MTTIDTNALAPLSPDQLKLVKEGERLDFLLRERRYVIQSPEFFSFSVDAVLLADFVRFPKRKQLKIIDFCSGVGIIPLLLSYQTSASIVGMELQADLVDMAQRSVQLNQLEDQITILEQDIRALQRSQDLVDVITCNPPYFTLDESHQIKDKTSLALARHELCLTLEDWVSKANLLLKDRGRLFIVFRPNRLDDLMEILLRYQFTINRMKFIYPKAGQEANGVLVEAILRGGRRGVRVEPGVVVHKANHDYTDQMKEIYYGTRDEGNHSSIDS